MEFKYSIGSIDEVCLGKVEKVDSLEELEIPKSSGLIILPKVVGVYQYMDELPKEIRNLIDKLFNSCESSLYPELISLLYDPTCMDENVLRKSINDSYTKDYRDYSNILDRDILQEIIEEDPRRIVITQYSETPNFKEKNVPKIKDLMRIIKKYNPNKTAASLMENLKERYKLEGETYGLTFFENIFKSLLDNSSIALNEYQKNNGPPRLERRGL